MEIKFAIRLMYLCIGWLKCAADRKEIYLRGGQHIVTGCPRKHEEEYIVYSSASVCVSQIGLRFRSHIMTDLQTIVWTGDFRVTLHVEWCQEF